MLVEVHSDIKRIDDVFALAGTLPADPIFMSHWARYTCVLACGSLENCVEQIVSSYVQKNASANVQTFASRYLQGFNNPNPQKITELLGSFSKDWVQKLEIFWDGERRDAIASIVANRHQISHGQTISLSFSRMKDWYKREKEVIEFLHGLILPGV